MVRTPATSVRSFTAIGRPASQPRPVGSGASRARRSAAARARSTQRVGSAFSAPSTRVDARERPRRSAPPARPRRRGAPPPPRWRSGGRDRRRPARADCTGVAAALQRPRAAGLSARRRRARRTRRLVRAPPPKGARSLADPTIVTPSVPQATMSGVPLEPLAVAAEHGPAPAPGEYPYTRGLHAEMYRSRLWTMRMFAGFGAPEDTNRRFRDLLAGGQTGLSTAFDMPALMGYDPDHELSLGEVGREGVSVASVDDMQRLFADIDLDAVSVSMTISGPGARRARALHGGCRAARLRPRTPARHAPDRHPQGVHRAARVDRAGARRDAARRRPDRLLRRRDAALAPGLDLRLPHPRGRLDGGAGARVHDRGRRSPTPRSSSRAASTPTASCRASRSSSTATSTSSRRSRSCARRGGCGRG